MDAKHYKNTKLTNFKALQMHVDMVQEIPEVIEVRLTKHEELLTIISGTRDDACHLLSDHRRRAGSYARRKASAFSISLGKFPETPPRWAGRAHPQFR